MEENPATSTRSPHTPILVVAGGGVVPHPPPSLVNTTIVQSPTTLGNGSIPSMTLTTVPSIQNASGAPFSYGMPSFESNSVITYSNLQVLGMGEGSSNAPL